MVDNVAVDNRAGGVAWGRGGGWVGEVLNLRNIAAFVEALVRFHALGGDACLREKSVCQRRYRQMSITEASPKLNSTQGRQISQD